MFEHDGAPFSAIELAALLSGGSSKEFESEITTGRFGTGFLVTHVLAEKTWLKALLIVGSRYEQFDLVLDRSGDEDDILANINLCSDAIRGAEGIVAIEKVPSATFRYSLPDSSVLHSGIEALRQALPFLYLTRSQLGGVDLQLEGLTESWAPEPVRIARFEDGHVEERIVWVQGAGGSSQQLRVFRFTAQESRAAAMVLLVKEDDGWYVEGLDATAPRIYREYPLRGSTFLPVNFVIDGKFDPDQERSRLLMSERDHSMITEAFDGAILAVKHGLAEKWNRLHLLARVARPQTVFDPTDDDEKQWWVEELGSLANRLARLPIVECSGGSFPAISDDGPYADFVVPRLSADDAENGTTVERSWPLVEAATDLYPPVESIARDWTETVYSWGDLGVSDLGLISLERLRAHVCADADRVSKLRVEMDALEWIARFVDLVGECWNERSGFDPAVLAGILPSQDSRLCKPEALARDLGISDVLKNICAGMGYDVRSHLLETDLTAKAAELNLTYLEGAVTKAVTSGWSEDQVIEDATIHLAKALPDGLNCDPHSEDLQKSSVRLLAHLWDLKGPGAAGLAHQIPLVTSESRITRWSPDRAMMAPVQSWSESAKPFANAYPPGRVLSGVYVGDAGNGLPNVTQPLVAWDMAIADPLTGEELVELKERRLSAIAVGDAAGIVVTGVAVSQIALLQPEVLNRCQEGREEAAALLGLVLCHIARHDRRWRERLTVRGRRSGKAVDVQICPALWLADLRVRSWVPLQGADGQTTKMPADAAALQSLLNPAWLEGNDAAVQLLSRWFGFDELELRLIGVAPDAQARKELRDGLAKLVESAGADAAVYTQLAADLAVRQRRARDVERCRRFGRAVQDAVGAAIEEYGLKVELVDRGFDYEVSLPGANTLEEASTTFQVGPYLVEVKATTSGGARLTPLQAETASRESARYVLCVVDLRDLSEEELDDWDAQKVESLAKLVTDIGVKTEETYDLVEEARTKTVAIRNDSALRYEVPAKVWEPGISIGDWVKSTFTRSPAI